MLYYNSSGNLAGEISFDEHQILKTSRIVLGFARSPQYQDWGDSSYVYNFGSSGLASTAGKLELYFNGEVVDELCWGKLSCENENPKFSTKFEDNYSLVRTNDGLVRNKYYPEIENVIETVLDKEEPKQECETIITEIFTYYSNSSSEQFIELYNPTQSEQDISQCAFLYKNKEYKLSGIISPGAYYTYKDVDLILTRNPTVFNSYRLGDNEILLPHGQKKGASYALFDYGLETERWLQTFNPTPGAANIYQEFQTCESGKVINPETGNCIKETDEKETICPEGKYLNPLTGRCKTATQNKTTACKDGYYRNIITGRCRKNTTTTTKECADGYERNPETNRCRKIRSSGLDYPVSEIEESNYVNPSIIITIGVVAFLALAGGIYCIYQYRKEIKQVILKICRRSAS